MSELKRFDIVGKYADEEVMYEFRPDGECYDADEVDKVIARSKEKLVEQTTLRVLAECQLRHNKYKRCLAMSKLCRSEWAAEIFIPGKCIGEKHTERYMRWEKRWLKNEEKFKGHK